MSRAIQLALGVLLTTIAAILLVLRETAVNPETAWVMTGVFAVPGLTLLALGLLPRRGMPPQVVMAFQPMTLLMGLAASAIGAAVIALHQFVFIIPHIAMIAALLAVPGGLLFAATSWSESCAKCRQPFDIKRVGFGAGREAVTQAIQSGSTMKILDVEPQAPGEHRFQLRMAFCPKCRKLAFLSEPRGAKTMLVGDVVSELLKRSGQR